MIRGFAEEENPNKKAGHGGGRAQREEGDIIRGKNGTVGGSRGC